MTGKKLYGSKLKVFSGKEESLNRVILLTLNSKKDLASYDVYLEIRKIKGFRHRYYKTIIRRMKALEEQGWIVQVGSRQAKPGWNSALYELTLRAKVALKLDKKSIEEFLQTASEEHLRKLIDALEWDTVE